ncbi:hypothetical protein [Streptomyces sp. NPDC047928]|uniref:WXG100 family type VII secretion target n=1 Tax=unclassified Streptomyces TaxID=2593676 RepID=UPI0037104CC1
MAGSEFEGKSLDALYAMIASARPGELTAVGDALEAAIPEIISIATDLRLYIDNVQWKGEGGDAFRIWGADMVSETLRLGDFTQVVASEMQRAGQALSEAKKAIPKPAGMCFADPDKEKARIEAETGPKLQEAIHQLERLSSYYKTTHERIASQPEPEFAPPRPPETGERAYASGGGAGAGSTYSSGGGAYAGSPYSTAGGASASSAGRQVSEPVIRPTAPPVVPEVPVGTNLDSVGTLPPESTTRPGPQAPVTPPTAGGPNTPPGPLLPPVAPVVGPQTGGGPSRTPSVPTGTGGPRGTGPFGALPPRAGGGDGIVGGKQMPGRAGGPVMPRLPMGTVVGEERTGFGRGAGMPGYGAGMQGAPGAGTGGGRRLATQPGGTVGAPGASGASGRGAFTPGGTGLVRPPASTASPQEERRGSSTRPDYLAEDEETWAMGQRKIVPPVID